MIINQNRIVIEFEKPTVLEVMHCGAHKISANGAVIEKKYVEAFDPFFIKLRPNTCEAYITSSGPLCLNFGGSLQLMNLKDIVSIREEESLRMIWHKNGQSNFVIEFKQGVQLVSKQAAIGQIVKVNGISVGTAMIKSWGGQFMMLEESCGLNFISANGMLKIIRGNENVFLPQNIIYEVYERGGEARRIWRNTTP